MTQKDNKVFKAVGSNTRLTMLQILSDNEMHISSLARKLEISVPVAAKHAKILEEAGLIERRIFGKSHILRIKTENIHSALDSFAPTEVVEVTKGTKLLDALKKVSALEVKKVGDRDLIVSSDGQEGLYVFEVDGKLSDKTAEEFIIEKDSTIDWKKLEAVTKKRLVVSIKE
ncbi:ArsR/SmtB family transcription factor [Methanosalsum natronophilum]|uniref:ArsR family transcriptional regulator n=1 Tax=Methanosalsum natronophilum TaxID=768733 RepID=A0A424Z042_9EURY|nr:winged helix-turn-helix domain-containing protein [Methanosalsum natronophilum]MCS3924383.1 DNA-binding transcriptional ArsR family regulator [Methanosalsum natronophilum]RQD87237.1 MAG: ArsR family transcriptional regulator [Methanosalsum natronophilum]